MASGGKRKKNTVESTEVEPLALYLLVSYPDDWPDITRCRSYQEVKSLARGYLQKSYWQEGEHHLTLLELFADGTVILNELHEDELRGEDSDECGKQGSGAGVSTRETG